MIQSICIFAGARSGARPEYAEAAAELGRTLAIRGLGLVYGGGRVGLMGVLADAALEAGGKVTGVIPRSLATREVAHAGLTELVVVETMHERKALMASRADAFIALPGGYGTLEELAEIVTWIQLGIHQKPLGLLDVSGFYRPYLSLIDHFAREGFVNLEERKLVADASDISTLLDRLSEMTIARPEAASPEDL